jgi:hypothetical protein
MRLARSNELLTSADVGLHIYQLLWPPPWNPKPAPIPSPGVHTLVRQSASGDGGTKKNFSGAKLQ